jgi:hypothetical protein
MNDPDSRSGAAPGLQSQAPRGAPFFKNWWCWLGIIVLLGGFVLYVRTWTQAVHLDFKPETNPPPPAAAPAQR